MTSARTPRLHSNVVMHCIVKRGLSLTMISSLHNSTHPQEGGDQSSGERERRKKKGGGGEEKRKNTHKNTSQLFSRCEQVLFVRFYNNPAPLNGSMQFHYCTLVTREPEQTTLFVLKRGVWRNVTWPLHSRPAIAASARHFQICFLP